MLIAEQLLLGADAFLEVFFGELQVEPGFFGPVLVKLADLAFAFAAVRRVLFRGFDPRAVVVVAFPGSFIENRTLAHLTGRPRVFGLGRDLVDLSRFKRDVQVVSIGLADEWNDCGQGENLETGWIGVHVLSPFCITQGQEVQSRKSDKLKFCRGDVVEYPHG